ncbi:unnamed protein product [Phyllotreta striolata]|uniref:Cytidine deaminase n=1 Tax=Phyllotreta striolata TaxID=444603 RepID=A0A9N9XSG9_PHYSR|nr:unnamed protein product [Phyllotreta striolata]
MDNEDVKKAHELDCQIQNLLLKATEAREFSYSPYSNFKVGAALLCQDDSIYTGCNVENSSFTVGTCAERCAYFKAISEGKRKFKAIAIVAMQKKWFTPPCGACRQLMSEFGQLDVYMTKPRHDDVLVSDLKRLLPYQFEVTDDKTFE